MTFELMCRVVSDNDSRFARHQRQIIILPKDRQYLIFALFLMDFEVDLESQITAGIMQLHANGIAPFTPF